MALEYSIRLRDDTTPVVLAGLPTNPESCYLLEDVQGLDGRDIREEVLDLPDRDGDYLGAVRSAGLSLILSGKIVGLDRGDLRAKERALRAALAPTDTTWRLRVQGRVGDPEELVAQVRTSQPFRSSDAATHSRRVKDWQVALRAADAVLYGAATQTVTTLPIIGLGGLLLPLVFPIDLSGSVAGGDPATNSGDAATFPLLRVYGPITQPILENLTTGEAIVFSGTIATGEYVEVNTATRDVTFGVAGGSAYFLLDRAQTSFWSMPPGTTQMRLRCSAFSDDARLVVTYSNAYL